MTLKSADLLLQSDIEENAPPGSTVIHVTKFLEDFLAFHWHFRFGKLCPVMNTTLQQ
jgi:hypothetical protein